MAASAACKVPTMRRKTVSADANNSETTTNEDEDEEETKEYTLEDFEIIKTIGKDERVCRVLVQLVTYVYCMHTYAYRILAQ